MNAHFVIKAGAWLALCISLVACDSRQEKASEPKKTLVTTPVATVRAPQLTSPSRELRTPPPQPFAQLTPHAAPSRPANTKIQVSGAILHADGSPASSATVAWVKNYRTAAIQRMVDAQPKTGPGYNGIWRRNSDPTTMTEVGTDAQGHYSLEADRDFGCMLVVSKPGYATIGLQPESGMVSYSGEPADTRKILLDLVLRKPASIRGHLVDENHQPITTVPLQAGPAVYSMGAPMMHEGSASAMTGADGSFVLEDLFEGEALVTCAIPGHVPLSKTVLAPANDLTLTLETTGAMISGRVMAASSGKPLPGTTVTLNSVGEHVPTSSTLTPGSPPPGVVAIPRFTPALQAPQLQQPQQYLARPSGIASQTTVTDSAGAYSFSQLPPGRYVTEAVKPPYKQVETSRWRPPGLVPPLLWHTCSGWLIRTSVCILVTPSQAALPHRRAESLSPGPRCRCRVRWRALPLYLRRTAAIALKACFRSLFLPV